MYLCVHSTSIVRVSYRLTNKEKKQQIDYVSPADSAGHIRELVQRAGNSWSYEDLMAQLTGAPPADGTDISRNCRQGQMVHGAILMSHRQQTLPSQPTIHSSVLNGPLPLPSKLSI